MSKKFLLIVLLGYLSLCGCKKQHVIIPNETNAISEEDISSEYNVQDEKVENEYKMIAVDYSDLFHDLNGCAVIYDFNANEYLVYNEEIANEQYSPYSTFKIILLRPSQLDFQLI